jgi:hypothetical protein
VPVFELCTVTEPETGTLRQEALEQLMRRAIGAVVSITISLFAPSESDEPGGSNGNVRVALLEELSRIVPLLADRELVDL